MTRTESLQRTRERLNLSGSQSGMVKSARELGKNNCLRCRRLKVKCFFQEGQERCRRCSVSKEVCEQLRPEQPTQETASLAPTDDRINQMQQMILDLQKTVSSLTHGDSSREHTVSVLTPPPSLGTASTAGYTSFRLSPGPDLTTNHSSSNDMINLNELISSHDFQELAVENLFCRAKRAVGGGLDYIVPAGLKSFEEAADSQPLLLQVLMTIATSTSPTVYQKFCEQTKRRLLHAYYHENVRNLDLLQAFLLASEYCVPFNQDACWNPHIYLSLANEVAADMGLFSDRHQQKFDNIETHRTLLWLFFVYSFILGSSARYAIRNTWLPCHDRAKAALSNSILKDRKLVHMLGISSLVLEMQQGCSQVGSPEVIKGFQQKIESLRQQPGTTSQIASLCLHNCCIQLGEAHIYSHKEDVSISRIYEHKEEVKASVMAMVDLIEGMEGDPMGYPFYILIKPIYCLIRVIKLFRQYGLDESMWLLSFADKVELALMNFASRGSAVASTMVGKTPLIMNYWAEPSLINDDPATIMSWALGIHWRPADPQIEQMDFLEFASMFNLDTQTGPMDMDYLSRCPHAGT